MSCPVSAVRYWQVLYTSASVNPLLYWGLCCACLLGLDFLQHIPSTNVLGSLGEGGEGGQGIEPGLEAVLLVLGHSLVLNKL